MNSLRYSVRSVFFLLLLFLLSACVGGQQEKYLGTWLCPVQFNPHMTSTLTVKKNGDALLISDGYGSEVTGSLDKSGLLVVGPTSFSLDQGTGELVGAGVRCRRPVTQKPIAQSPPAAVNSTAAGSYATLPNSPPRASLSPSPVAPAPAASALSPLWHGKWVGRDGESVQITNDRFAGCTWINVAAEFPKRKGCWAYYGSSQSGAQLVGLDGKTKLNPESVVLAKSIVTADKFKTVQIQYTDERGKVEDSGDCSTFYFYDKQRVIRGRSCQRDSGFETDLLAFAKA